MSLFAMGINSMELNEEKIELARVEFESLAMLFDSLLTTCKTKCIPNYYGEEDLNKGEMVCIDRCVSKYFKTNLKVGEYLRQTNQGPEALSSYTHTQNAGITNSPSSSSSP